MPELDVTTDESFAQFVEQHSEGLRRYTYTLTRDWHLSEDIVQSALLKMYLRWKRIDPPGRVSFARVTILRMVIDQSRRRRFRESSLDAFDRPENENRSGEVENSDLINRAMVQLSPTTRAVLTCRFIEDFDVETTSRILGIPRGTVKSRTARGLAVLREALDGHLVQRGQSHERNK